MNARILLVGALLALPLAHAQTTNNSTADPTVGANDFNTTAPSANDSYLNDTSADPNATSTTPTDNTTAANTTDPTLNESDMNTSVPTTDLSYLNDAPTTGTPTPGDGGSTPSADSSPTKAATPGFETIALVAGAVGAAVLTARRR